MAEALRTARNGGLLPFANSNRIHVVPPCTITDSEAAEGLHIIDQVLGRVDALVKDAHLDDTHQPHRRASHRG